MLDVAAPCRAICARVGDRLSVQRVRIVGRHRRCQCVRDGSTRTCSISVARAGRPAGSVRDPGCSHAGARSATRFGFSRRAECLPRSPSTFLSASTDRSSRFAAADVVTKLLNERIGRLTLATVVTYEAGDVAGSDARRSAEDESPTLQLMSVRRRRGRNHRPRRPA